MGVPVLKTLLYQTNTHNIHAVWKKGEEGQNNFIQLRQQATIIICQIGLAYDEINIIMTRF